MTRQAVSTTGAPPAAGPYSQAIVTGDFVFCAGQLGTDPSTGQLPEGVQAQTAQALRNLQAVLDAAGCTFADVVKVTVFLTDIADRPLVNPVRHEVFGDARPASTLVEVSALVIPGARTEVEAVALIPA
jgi:2-iminobutanoate/2-iminopropanoate deaminase